MSVGSGKKYVGGADKELSVKKHKCIARGLWGSREGVSSYLREANLIKSF